MQTKGRYAKQYKDFHRRLKQARIEAGLTQVEVAARLKVRQSFVANCESGERRVDFIELLVLAKLYSKPLDFFIPDSAG